MPPSLRLPVRTPRPAPAALLVASLLVVGGCSVRFGGSTSLEASANALRAENAQLSAQLATATARIKELEALAAERSPQVAADALAALPVVTELEIDRWSGVDLRDPGAPQLVVYASLLDARKRPLQGVGSLHIVASVGDAGPAQRRFERTLSPTQLRDAYRSGATGTHYRIAWPIPPSDAEALRAGPLRIDARFEDALTPNVLTAIREVQ